MKAQTTPETLGSSELGSFLIPPNGLEPSALVTLPVDLGTHTGWALMEGDQIVDSGTELLASDEELQRQRENGTERTSDLRFGRFLDFLARKLACGVNRIVFEDVLFAGSQAQTQLWSSLRAAIWLAGRDQRVKICCVATASLKRFATGNGCAKKPEMAQALAAARPDQYRLDPQTGLLWHNSKTIDDNEVDAIWLALYARAVDAGTAGFIGPHQRKAAAKAERRAKRAAAKAQKRARAEAQRAEARAKRQALMEAIKSAGRCCGVLRKPAAFGRAACPKCRRLVTLAKPGIPAESPIAQD